MSTITSKPGFESACKKLRQGLELAQASIYMRSGATAEEREGYHTLRTISRHVILEAAKELTSLASEPKAEKAPEPPKNPRARFKTEEPVPA